MQPVAWSWSRLQTFEQCPRKFYYTTLAENKRKQAETEVLRRGNQVHKAIEDFINVGKALPGDLKHIEPMIESLRMQGYKVIAEPPYALDKDWQPCSPTPWTQTPRGPEPLVRAKIDVLAIKGNHAIQIDWKTGKPKNSDGAQLDLCALIIMAHCPEIQEVSSCFAYTAHKKSSVTRSVTREMEPELKHHFLERADRMQQVAEASFVRGRKYDRDNWQPQPSGLCPYCPVTDRDCEYRER